MYTYAEVDEASDRIAVGIQHLAPTTTVIGVHLNRGPELYMTLVGVWKAGKGYMPIDPALPEARVTHMLSSVEQAGWKAAIISPAPLDCFTALTVISPDRLATECVIGKPHINTDLSSTSYVLFTSGSTGKPKGVHLTHTALSGALMSWKSILPHKPTSRLLQLASPGFDVSIMEICLPLALGFSLASGPKEWLLTDLTAALKTLGVTMADLPAALVGYVDPQMAERLEWIMSGGDAMDARVLDVWGPTGKLINAWGPTETTVGNTLGFMHANTARTVVGTAYPASTVLVVRPSANGERSVTLLGCEGEIAIAGPQLATGYVGRPDLTAQAFTHLEDGTLIYLTGDSGRLLAGGVTQVLGRIDKSMVKVNGQRVELDEISAAFCEAGSDGVVADAISLYVRHASGARKQLVTILAPVRGVEPEDDRLTVRSDGAAKDLSDQLLAQVRQTLAPYMVPARVIVVAQSRFPLTVNNKVNRQAIEAFYLHLDLGLGSTSTSAPQQDANDARCGTTDRQATIRSVVAAVVGCSPEQVGLSEPFVRLGLDSIASIALAQRLSKALGVPVRPRTVVENDSVVSLASVLGQGEHQSKPQRVRTTETNPEKDELLPCLPMQVGMLSQALASQGHLYVHDFVVPIGHEVAVYSALLRALRAWDTLCLSFALVPNAGQDEAFQQRGMSWVQSVRHDHASVLAEALDVGRLEASRAHALIAKGSQPWAVRVDGNRLKLSVHHALYDATSMDALLEFLSVELGSNGGTQAAAPLPFAPLIRGLLPTSGDQDFWVERLTPTHFLQPLPLRASAASTSCVVSLRSVEDLTLTKARALAAERGVTLAVVASLATAWVRAGIDGGLNAASVVLGRVSSLRSRLDVTDEPTVVSGCLLNTLPALVPTGPLSRLSIHQALVELKEQMDQEAKHDRASLRDVVRSVTAKRCTIQSHFSDGQVFDLLLDYQIPATSSIPSMSSDDPELDGEYPDQVQYGLNFEVRTGPRDQLTVRVLTPRSSRFNVERQLRWTRLVAQWWVTAVRSLLLAGPQGTVAQALKHSKPQMWEDLPPAPKPENEPSLPDFVAPATAAAGSIVRLRRAVAHVTNMELDKVLDTTRLNDLGVDSVTAIAIVHQYLHLDAPTNSDEILPITLRHILDGKTPQGIVQLGLAAHSTQPRVSGPLGLETNIPLLVSQIEHLDADAPERELNTFAYLFTGFSSEQVVQAWRGLETGHEVLRLIVEPVRQVAHVGPGDTDNILVRPHDSQLALLEAQDLRNEASDIARHWAHWFYEQLTPRTSPQRWVQVQVIPLTQTKLVVLLHIHHALYDAQSLSVLLHDWERLLQKTNTPVGPDHYAQFARAASAYSQREDVQARWVRVQRQTSFSHVGHWLTEPSPDCIWKPSSPETLIRTTQVQGGIFVSMDQALTDVAQLELSLVRSRWAGQMTLRSLLLACWGRAISRFWDGGGACVDVVRLGRAVPWNTVDLQGSAIPLAHALPLEIRLPDSGSLSTPYDVLEAAKAVQVALEQDRPYELTSSSMQDGRLRFSEVVINILWPISAGVSDPKRSASPVIEQLDVGLRQDYAYVPEPEPTYAVRLDIVYDPERNSVGFGALVANSNLGAAQTVARILNLMVFEFKEVIRTVTAQ